MDNRRTYLIIDEGGGHKGNIFSEIISFLGYVSLPRYRVLRTKTKKRMFRNIRRKLLEKQRGNIGDFEFNQTLQSYFGQLSHCKGYKVKQELGTIIKSVRSDLNERSHTGP